MLEFFRCGGASQQPQRTELCQCVSGQLWTFHERLRGHQMQPMQRVADVVEPALGAAARLGRWLVGVRFCCMLEFPDVEAPLGNNSAQSPASV